jgi:amino acid adenylation domain-containing protein
MTATLITAFEAAAERHAGRTAVVGPGGEPVTYDALRRRARRIAGGLLERGVRRGDCVIVCQPKSVDAVAALYGVMMAGAAYVPVDPESPPARAASIAADCRASAIVTDRADRPALAEVAAPVVEVDGLATSGAEPVAAPAGDDDLAYVLFTSGSTGRPKGVPLTHANAGAFLDWCSATFAPTPDDRFSSHAPFTFDLSILDVHLGLRHGAAVVLVDHHAAVDPRALAGLIAEHRITVWYSVPSILGMMAEHGRLDEHEAGSLRLVLFAGEVFPPAALARLRAAWPHPVYWNLYGPTETNVCTAFRCPDAVAPGQTHPHPIGRACAHCVAVIVNEDGNPCARPGRGRLLIGGPSVMGGYLNRPDLSERAFRHLDGVRYYDTGDLVDVDADGCMTFRGRADRMIKRRGYRIEPGEIEAALARRRSSRRRRRRSPSSRSSSTARRACRRT